MGRLESNISTEGYDGSLMGCNVRVETYEGPPSLLQNRWRYRGQRPGVVTKVIHNHTITVVKVDYMEEP